MIMELKHNRNIRGVPVNWIGINHPHRHQVARSVQYHCQVLQTASKNFMEMRRLLVSKEIFTYITLFESI